MKHRLRLYRRKGGVYYIHDSQSGKQASLGTRDRREATELFSARLQAHRQAHLNLQLARTYLTATDPMVARRTWEDVMNVCVKIKDGKTRIRYERAIQEKAFDSIRPLRLIETQAEHLLRVLESGSVSTNNFLRRFHNFAVGMTWLPWPVLPKKLWPPVRYGEKRAITREEHEAIVQREQNDELRAFYEACWHLGGAQTDMANLKGEDVDWTDRVISFFRAKTGSVQIVRFDSGLEAILRTLPKEGLLFPSLAPLDEKHRASLFQRACRRAGVQGVSLHCYRYSWAERAKLCGYPERFAQEALGHNSKAVHRAYARKAQVKLPALETYEKRSREAEVIPMPRLDGDPTLAVTSRGSNGEPQNAGRSAGA